MIELENQHLKVKIELKGAQLISLFHKGRQVEYLHDYQDRTWPRSAPHLFPIVGGLKENQYVYEGKRYFLSRHGFLRDQSFELVEQTTTTCLLRQESTLLTKEFYPFDYRVLIRMEIIEMNLKITYHILNKGASEMYFSLGFHPGFKLDLSQSTTLQFTSLKPMTRCVLQDGFVLQEEPLDCYQIVIEQDQGLQDTLVYGQVHQVDVYDETRPLTMTWSGFPWCALWAPALGDQIVDPCVCIEPWAGLSDEVDHDFQLDHKKGMISLSSKENKSFYIDIALQ